MFLLQILLLPRDKLDGELHKRFQRHRKVRIILESCLADVDDATMLFHDF